MFGKFRPTFFYIGVQPEKKTQAQPPFHRSYGEWEPKNVFPLQIIEFIGGIVRLVVM